jgi:hypothetical protein
MLSLTDSSTGFYFPPVQLLIEVGNDLLDVGQILALKPCIVDDRTDFQADDIFRPSDLDLQVLGNDAFLGALDHYDSDLGVGKDVVDLTERLEEMTPSWFFLPVV